MFLKSILLIKVVITDLGEIGENAIVVFEEAVGVGAEEIVCGQVIFGDATLPYWQFLPFLRNNTEYSELKNLLVYLLKTWSLGICFSLQKLLSHQFSGPGVRHIFRSGERNPFGKPSGAFLNTQSFSHLERFPPGLPWLWDAENWAGFQRGPLWGWWGK